MITLQDLMGHLDELLPCEGVEDYCPNGMQVEGDDEVGKIATAVTADLETIEAAAKWGAKALIVHHGLFWRGQPQLLVGGMKKRVACLIEHGMSLISYHLPLDSHETLGNNFAAARDLGLRELEPFAGIGVRGRLEPTPIGEWAKKVEAYYDHPVHAVLGGPDRIKKVAIVSGASHRLIDQAIKAGIHCFITGSFDLPVWPTAREEGIHFLAVGHSNSERVGPRALAAHLAKRFHLEVQFVDTKNPF